MSIFVEKLLERYDQISWEIAETYGANTGFGNKFGVNVVAANRKRIELNEERKFIRQQIISLCR